MLAINEILIIVPASTTAPLLIVSTVLAVEKERSIYATYTKDAEKKRMSSSSKDFIKIFLTLLLQYHYFEEYMKLKVAKQSLRKWQEKWKKMLFENIIKTDGTIEAL